MSDTIMAFLNRGGPAMWVIAALSVLTLTLILWKIWQLARLGVLSRGAAFDAVAAHCAGDATAAEVLSGRRGLRSQVALAAIRTLGTRPLESAREETARVARAALLEARTGLRTLELIATIAPLVGLLGTVLGMIEAFQALQDSGAQADAAALAGGIWQALLTTAAGMVVAIPAGVALSVFDGVADRLAHDFEDLAARLFAGKAA